jgi:hypothetical protein
MLPFPVPPNFYQSNPVSSAPPAFHPAQTPRGFPVDWSPREDYLLLQAVANFGLGDWSKIANFIGNHRTKSQCSQHWFRSLNPAIVKGRWDPEEDENLLQLIAKFGPGNWVRIARGMGTRSDVQCRHRYAHLCKPTPDSADPEQASERDFFPSIENLMNKKNDA